MLFHRAGVAYLEDGALARLVHRHRRLRPVQKRQVARQHHHRGNKTPVST